MSSFSYPISTLTGIKEKTEQLRFFLILLFVFSLPFDLFYSSVILIGLLVTTLLDIDREKVSGIPKQVWIFQLIFLLGVAGYFYSSHKNVASFLLERQLGILLLPLVLPMAVKINRQKADLLLIVLAFSCIIAVCYLFVHMVHAISYSLKLPLWNTLFSGAFFNHQFSRPIGIHAGYLSLYVALAIFYLIQVYNRTTFFRLKFVLIISLIILFSGLFFLASRNIIIATFFILIFISPLFNSKNKLRYIAVALICFVSCFFILKNVPYLKDRFFVQLISDIKPIKNGGVVSYYGAEPRYERWEGARELIKKSPLIGYGTGDEIEMLKTEYIKRELYISYLESFNAHNEYLSFLLKNGVLGLGLFLFAFFYYSKLAITSKDFMYVSFLVLLLIGFYTENILDANKGIIFFALFNTFFGYSALGYKQQEMKEITS